MLDYTAMYHGDTELKRLYRGGTLIWEKPSPAPAYDETKVAAILLDENLDRTSTVSYFDTLAELVRFLPSDATPKYDVIIGLQTGITVIPDSCFIRAGTFIKSIARCFIESPVVSIGQRAFQFSMSLIHIEFSQTLQTVGYAAFEGCPLTEIILPSSVTSLEQFCFYSGTITRIIIDKPSGSVSGAPWGATNATVAWTG